MRLLNLNYSPPSVPQRVGARRAEIRLSGLPKEVSQEVPAHQTLPRTSGMVVNTVFMPSHFLSPLTKRGYIHLTRKIKNKTKNIGFFSGPIDEP